MAIDALKNQPVRCKECEHWDTTWQNDFAPNYHYCPLIDGTHRDDFYCAYAELRSEAREYLEYGKLIAKGIAQGLRGDSDDN